MKFTYCITRDICEQATVTVEADNEDEARTLAHAQVEDVGIDWSTTDWCGDTHFVLIKD